MNSNSSHSSKTRRVLKSSEGGEGQESTRGGEGVMSLGEGEMSQGRGRTKKMTSQWLMRGDGGAEDEIT